MLTVSFPYTRTCPAFARAGSNPLRDETSDTGVSAGAGGVL